MSVPVQLWAPATPAEPLAVSLRGARLTVTELSEFAQRHADQPLLVAYADPVGLLATHPNPRFSPDSEDPYAEVLAAVQQLEGAALPWRLVNLSCLEPAAVVAWCVSPHSDPPHIEAASGFARPDALDALVARQWLESAPGVLAAYLRLECHPRSAELDHRPADDACLDRLREASSPAALAAARNHMLAELAAADERVQELQRMKLENQSLRERLVSLELELAHTYAHSDVELSLQLSQEELGQLSRRNALLQQLVSEAAEATRWMQGALAQLLTS